MPQSKSFRFRKSGDGLSRAAALVGRGGGFAAIAATAGILLLVASTIPRRTGRARVAGIGSTVRIETDSHGVPTIRAATFEDALFGLGWAHARDRLWQMEFQRRVGSGRLAEILGKNLLPTDRFLRTVGFRRAAEAALQSLSPTGRARLAAYRSGINAWLASTSVRPAEARLLAVTIVPFDDADCAVWSR